MRTGVTARLALQLPAEKYHAVWNDTQTGRQSKLSLGEHNSGVLTLTTPPFDNDIAVNFIDK